MKDLKFIFGSCVFWNKTYYWPTWPVMATRELYNSILSLTLALISFMIICATGLPDCYGDRSAITQLCERILCSYLAQVSPILSLILRLCRRILYFLTTEQHVVGCMMAVFLEQEKINPNGKMLII